MNINSKEFKIYLEKIIFNDFDNKDELLIIINQRLNIKSIDDIDVHYEVVNYFGEIIDVVDYRLEISSNKIRNHFNNFLSLRRQNRITEILD